MAQVFNILNHKMIQQNNGVALVHYIEPVNTLKAEVSAANFFLPAYTQLAIGSTIICSVKDGVMVLAVATSTATGVTTTVLSQTA